MDPDWYTDCDDRIMSTIDAPTFQTFRKDWAQAVAAGFDRINDGGAYGTPTDEFLKGMARDFEQQKRDWEYKLQELGVLESVYDDAGVGRWVYVTPDEAAKIRESNSEALERQTKAVAAQIARAKVKLDNKWYRKLFKRGAKK